MLNITEKVDKKLTEVYWTSKLKELPVQLPIVQSGTSSFIKDNQRHSASILFPSEIMMLLDKVSTSSEQSKLVLLLATLHITYHRYFQIDDVLISTPSISNLQDSASIDLYRISFHFEETILDIIEKVQQQLFDMKNKGGGDLDKITKKLLSIGQINQLSFRNIYFVYDSIHQNINVPEEVNVFMRCIEDQGNMKVELDVNGTLNDPSFVAQFVRSWMLLLKSALLNVNQKVSSIPILSEDECNLIFNGFNKNYATYDNTRNVIELFENVVNSHPDSEALFHGGKILTYRGLNNKVNKISNGLLNTYGVNKGDRVAIMVDRSEWLVIGLMAILKTGAAYVPIELSCPEERLQYIIRDSNAKILLTEDFCLDRDLECEKVDIKQIMTSDCHNPDIEINPDDVVFAIYTSGSTGTPKGVLQTHRCISNLIQWQINNGHFQRGLKVLQWSSAAFDACIHEVLFGLLSGGQIQMIDEFLRRDLIQLGKFIKKNEIAVFWQTASALNLLFEVSDEIKKSVKIKHIISTGEQLRLGDSLRKFLLRSPQVRLHNFYGPTETHVVTASTIGANTDLEIIYQSIGKPIPNSQCFILDKNKEPVPIGVVGELYLGGAGLALGYLNKPELSSDKFGYFLKQFKSLLYKTGDYCKWLPDGKIEYLGRADDQVKIRGQLVEIREIEQQLLKLNEIYEAVVLAIEDKENNNVLVAYIVAPENFNRISVEETLKRSLPEYMIPTHFVRKLFLPLTSTGKIDKKALKREGLHEITSDEDFIEPTTITQKRLSILWSKILDCNKEIGIKDNFFKIGGHSLKATRLVSMLYKELAVNISLRDVFTNPTLEAQARLIEKADSIQYEPIEPASQEMSHYQLSHAQRRLWILDSFEKNQVAYNMLGSFLFKGKLDCHAFEKSLISLIERHEILRTTFFSLDDGSPRQKVHACEGFPFKMVYHDLLHFKEKTKQVEKLADEDSNFSFSLEKGPLIKATLIRVEEGRYVFLFTLHHIVCDGWSLNIIVNEILKFYNSYITEQPNPFKKLRIQYKDFAEWQFRQLKKDNLKDHEMFWLTTFGDELPLLNLPTDKERPKVQTFKGDLISFTIEELLTLKLNDFSRNNDVTLFMTLMSAVNAIFNRYTGQEDITIGTPIAGRQHPDLENQIGLYVNTLALRTRFCKEDSFVELLKKTKEITLNAYDHQIYPFDVLVEKLNIPRSNRNPIFDVMVALQNTQLTNESVASMSGVSVEGFKVKNEASKFDMWLSFSETGKNIVATLQYNTDLYNADRMVRFSNHLINVLEAIVDDAETSIEDLDYLSAGEKQKLLNTFNQVDFLYPSEDTVTSLFEKQVMKTPNAVAFTILNGRQLTYSELNKKTNQIAHYLKEIFLTINNEVVGVLIDDPENKIVAIWSILKAGAAYVPIDPKYPQKRIEYIISDSGIKYILSESKFKTISNIHGTKSVYLDRIEQVDSYPTNNPEIPIHSDSLIYVIYTSGSTGLPKGCELNHQGIVNRIHWMWLYYQLTQRDVVLQKTPIVFDVSVWEIFMTLCFGARLVACRTKDIYPSENIIPIIEAYSITSIHFVPSMFETFVSAIDARKNKFNSLKRIFLSGEVLSMAAVNSFQEKSKIPLINLYGPTEASVDVTHFEIPQHPKEILIGRPINNIRIYILDAKLGLVPPGIVGEIYLSGVGLAQGYRNNKTLTNSKFISNPFKDNDRLYKTGDLGAWTKDGNIKFYGRNDEQIKIRGQRIELGEIEAAISSHERVKMALVSVYKQNDQSLLSAYVRCHPVQLKEGNSIEKDQMFRWEAVFDEVYDTAKTSDQKQYNFSGWINSYTLQPFPENEMMLWLEDAIDNILSCGKPGNVLEIGCGVGLVTFQIAGKTRQYVGTDISSISLKYVQSVLEERKDLRNKVKLLKRPAHNFIGFYENQFDTIVLNSVVQYFPSLEYLLSVIEEALKFLKPGGVIFIGDVRSLPLLDQFHLSVQLFKSSDTMSAEELADRVNYQTHHDKELVIHPDFFVDLKSRIESIKYIEIRPKKGTYINELSKYRYQVVIHKEDRRTNAVQDISWHEYKTELKSESFTQLINNNTAGCFGISHIPNSIISEETKILDCLLNTQVKTIREVKSRKVNVSVAINDAEWIKDNLPPDYFTYVYWARHGSRGQFDIIFIKKGLKDNYNPAAIYFNHIFKDFTRRPLNFYSNEPLKEKVFDKWVPSLREYLSERLPDYMMPSVFIPISYIPVSTNGKINKKALRPPLDTRSVLGAEYIPAQNDQEKKMVTIWQEVLQIDMIGIQDNFFELGGHSLNATQLLMRIHREFDVKLELRDIFMGPTIEKLLVLISNFEIDPFASIKPLPSKKINAPSHAQRCLWTIHQLGDASVAYNMMGSYYIIGELNLEALQKAFQTEITRHESLRTSFEQIDGEPMQVIHDPDNILFKIEYLDLMGGKNRHNRAKEIANHEANYVFDLSSIPLVRAQIIRMEDDHHLFLLNMHHIISDGWSIRIMAHEIFTLYNAFCEGKESPLPPLPVQYKDFAAWQNKKLSGNSLLQLREYWVEQLKELPVLSLETDFSRPDIRTFNGKLINEKLDSLLYSKLKMIAHEEKSTLFIVLLSCVKTLLYKYTGQDDIVIGTPVAGRNHIDIEKLIGFFVNTLVIRTKFNRDKGFRELLIRVKNVMTEAFTHQDYPFDLLVDDLSVTRDISRSPLFDVNVVLQNTDIENMFPEVKMQGIKFNKYDTELHVSKFDLIFDFRELNDQLMFQIEYNTDIFSLTRIERMANHLKQLMASIVENRIIPLKKLNYLTEVERKKIVLLSKGK